MSEEVTTNSQPGTTVAGLLVRGIIVITFSVLGLLLVSRIIAPKVPPKAPETTSADSKNSAPAPAANTTGSATTNATTAPPQTEMASAKTSSGTPAPVVKNTAEIKNTAPVHPHPPFNHQRANENINAENNNDNNGNNNPPPAIGAQPQTTPPAPTPAPAANTTVNSAAATPVNIPSPTKPAAQNTPPPSNPDPKPEAPKNTLVRMGGNLKITDQGGLTMMTNPDLKSGSAGSLAMKKSYDITGRLSQPSTINIHGVASQDYWYLISDPKTKKQGWVFGFYTSLNGK